MIYYKHMPFKEGLTVVKILVLQHDIFLCFKSALLQYDKYTQIKTISQSHSSDFYLSCDVSQYILESCFPLSIHAYSGVFPCL